MSGRTRRASTSPSASAYGRAAATRSVARFILLAATISIVRVILRVFSTDLMRPLSSRPLAMAAGAYLTNWALYASMPRLRSASVSLESALLVRIVSPTCGYWAFMYVWKPVSQARTRLVSMPSR
jgi:hypothetical protein